jgi:outer membrane receptor protein involved in Fe transport
VNVQGIYAISDWTFSVIGRYWTGLPYTPNLIPEERGASAVSGFLNNSARLPDQKTVDLTISKTFRLEDMLSVQLFVNVYNLFDQRDATNVYADTGSPDYTDNISPDRIPFDPTRISTVEDFVIQPSWFTAPRQIQAGIAVDF